MGTSIFEQIEHRAEQKAKVNLQKMYGKDFSEYELHESILKTKIELQKLDKDKILERNVGIR